MTEDGNGYPPVSPYRAGIAGRCPRCGRGRLFGGLLAIAPDCEACGLDYSFADAGDGPAVFVIFIAGFLVAGLALATELALRPPIWLHMVIWLPFTLVISLVLLRLLKGLLITLQYRNDAAEGRLDLPES